MLKIDQLRVCLLKGGASAAEASAACRNAVPAVVRTHTWGDIQPHIALALIFAWRDSPEGYKFWCDVYSRLMERAYV